MSLESSSPTDADGLAFEERPVVVFVIGRTLRGTLGERFRRFAVQRFDELEGPGPAPAASLSRTVELTAVAVSRAAFVRVDTSIADPAFGVGRATEGVPAETAGRSVVSVAAESLAGIRPVAGPAGVDRSRTITVTVGDAGGSRHPVAVRFEVVPDDTIG